MCSIVVTDASSENCIRGVKGTPPPILEFSPTFLKREKYFVDGIRRTEYAELNGKIIFRNSKKMEMNF